jgi:hypothetical protein
MMNKSPIVNDKSMLYLNFSNAEELVFFDTDAQRLLPSHMFSIFEQWRLAKRIPYLKEMGKQAILDFLNTITDDDLVVLEEYFGQKIIVEKLNYSIASNYKVPLSESGACEVLCGIEGFNYFSTWRDDEYLYISAWR